MKLINKKILFVLMVLLTGIMFSSCWYAMVPFIPDELGLLEIDSGNSETGKAVITFQRQVSFLEFQDPGAFLVTSECNTDFLLEKKESYIHSASGGEPKLKKAFVLRDEKNNDVLTCRFTTNGSNGSGSHEQKWLKGKAVLKNGTEYNCTFYFVDYNLK